MQKNRQGSYFAYFAYWNMQNMQNMSNNMLQYAKQYAKYAFFGEICPFIWWVWVEALMRSEQKAKRHPRQAKCTRGAGQ
jgi:hypothetical protein